MKNVSVLLSSLILLASCQGLPTPPIVERCIISVDTCVCVDRRVQKEAVIYPIDHCLNYIAVSPDGYNELELWMDEVVKECKINE